MQSFELQYYGVKNLDEAITKIEEATKYYLRSLKSFARQVYTSSSELMKSSSLSVLQSKCDDFNRLHANLVKEYSGSNLFNIRSKDEDAEEYSQKIVTRNFEAVVRVPWANLHSLRTNQYDFNTELDFDKVKMQSSLYKEPSHMEFETHASHLQVLPHSETFDMGHIYCGTMMKPKVHLYCGKFGTVISNTKDNILGRVELHVERVLAVISKKNLQIYFLPNEKAAFI